MTKCEQQFKFKHSETPLIRTPSGHAKVSVLCGFSDKVKVTCFIDKKRKADNFTATKCLNST